jgi:predicted phosphodiesterase
VRTALIADIHGNLVALDAVLSDIERRGADRVVCLGDVAATGPQPCEAIDRIAEIGCQVVMGNTDEWLIEPRDESIEDDDTRRIVEIDLWAHEQLGEHHLDRLRGYQPLLELDGLLCYHGSPRSNTEVLLPITTEAELAAMLDGHDEAIMAGGHTHMPMLRRHGPSLIVNPGSVGMPFEHTSEGTFRNPPWAEYAIAGDGEIEFIRVPVDVGAVTGATLKSGMPNAGWWVKDWAWE